MSSSISDNDGGSRTILWCVPRAISTALAKCFSFIDNNEVWFEPYCYSRAAVVEHKFQTQLDIPLEYEGNEEIFQKVKAMMEGMSQCSFEPDRLPYGSVKRRLEATTAKHVFVKDMAFGVTEGYRQYLPKGYRHTFLVRHPDRTLFSYHKMIYNHLSMLGLLEGEAASSQTFDIERHDRFFPSGYFFKEIYDLWKYVKNEDIDANPIVIDSDDLLTKPAETLLAYCAKVGLPYNESLLHWDASTEVLTKMKAAGDDLVMGMVNFYGAAMKSSCFLPPNKHPPRDQLPDSVIRCSDKVMEYYDEMYATRLKV